MKTQRIEHEGPRLETGPVKFGDDWTGIFIRGDEALAIASILKRMKFESPEFQFGTYLNGVAEILIACRENDK